MTPIQAIVLALVQAVTEFLPVSSSGHLILVPRLLGWADQGLEFDIATNSGTLLAVLVYFRTDLAGVVRGLRASFRPGGAGACAPEARLGYALLWGTVPAGAVGLLVKDWVASYARAPYLIATTAIVYGLLLGAADLWGRKRLALSALGARQGLLIGCAQALALVPGTSRSGVTMSAALALGVTREAAARFAFLLAVPVGLLVGAKQVVDALRGEPLGVPLDALLVGIAVSALAGYAVIAILLGWVRRRSLLVFAAYRVALGVFLFLYFSGS
jgi:undecaprenyl-diphosphatase